ncbi:Alpha/Beta hydrolase protein, partial [Lactarius quietus]
YTKPSVTLTGHSLGAALSLLNTVYLPLHLPTGTSVYMVGYGMPCVGNAAFADYVDAGSVRSLIHVNNREDPIPTLPFTFLGFVHPSGKAHIQDSGTWVGCSGQDNPSTMC